MMLDRAAGLGYKIKQEAKARRLSESLKKMRS